MTPRMDIWRAAKLLVDQHGADSALRPAQQADELLAAGDIEGRAVWLRVLAAVKDAIDTQAPELYTIADVNKESAMCGWSRSMRLWVSLHHAHDKLIRTAQRKGSTIADIHRKAEAMRRLERYQLRIG